MTRLTAVLSKTDAAIRFALKWITISLFLALMAIITVNILLRYFPVTSFHWMDEIVELCFGALVFYGAAAVWMAKGHFSVGDWISKRIRNEKGKIAYRLVIELFSLLFAAVLFKYSLQITLRTMEVTAVFQIPKRVLYSCMPISSFIMVAYSVANCIVLAGKILYPLPAEEVI
jgi:TRAP-type C4-dicarboxylate transport system permease small subunit